MPCDQSACCFNEGPGEEPAKARDSVGVYQFRNAALEILQQLDNCILGDYKFLYISPERISSELFQEKLKTLSSKVNLLVVDEAHCISQWGNDFRRDYRLIADIRDAIPHVQVIAVTASATAAVVADICEQLHFRKGYRIFKTSFERKNLSFVVRKTDNKFKGKFVISYLPYPAPR